MNIAINGTAIAIQRSLMMYGANIAAANMGVKFGGCGMSLPKARMPEIYKNDNIIFIIVLPQPLLLNTVICNTIYNTIS